MSYSPRLNRSARQPVATQKLIVFHLRQERFALPIQFAYRVVPMGQVFGTNQGAGNGLMMYQGQQLLVLDIDRLVFQSEASRPAQLPASKSIREMHDSAQVVDPSEMSESDGTELISANCVLILKNSQGDLIGLPLSYQPSLMRVPESAFVPVPPHYLESGHIRCISALVIPNPEESPLFLLNLTQLVQPTQPLLVDYSNFHA